MLIPWRGFFSFAVWSGSCLLYTSHRGRTDLILAERLLQFAEALKQAHIVGKLVGALRDAGEDVLDAHILLARISLTGDREHRRKTETFGDAAFQFEDLIRVAAEQAQERRLRTGRAFIAEEAQVICNSFQVTVIDGEVLQPERSALEMCIRDRSSSP